MGNEIWKDIPGWEGYYQVSNLGRVKSLERVAINSIGAVRKYPGIKLKHCKDRGGYFNVVLCRYGKDKMIQIHQLVAMAFLGHKPNKHELVVNHKNFNKTDNRVENLELITQRENTNLRQSPSTSKYPGVSWSKERNKWVAQIYINKKKINLGRFKNEHDAHLAYQYELNCYFGFEDAKKQLSQTNNYGLSKIWV